MLDCLSCHKGLNLMRSTTSVLLKKEKKMKQIKFRILSFVMWNIYAFFDVHIIVV